MNKVLIAIIFAVLEYQSVGAEELNMSFGDTLPPWVIENGQRGLLIDLVDACLTPSGHVVNVELVPYARRILEYKNGRVNAVTDITPELIVEQALTGYYTGTLYAYENYFYALADNQFELNSISDIGQRSVVSWQGAKVVIGGEYQRMAENNRNYSEIDRQEAQVRLLVSGRVDFIQMDKEIFNYYLNKFIDAGIVDKHLAFDRFELLGASPNGILFQSKQVRDDCLMNLRALPQNHPLQAILRLPPNESD